MSPGLSRAMGDESKAFLVPLFYHDVRVRRGERIEYIGNDTGNMVVAEDGTMVVEEMEQEAAGLVEDRWQEADEEEHDLWAKETE